MTDCRVGGEAVHVLEPNKQDLTVRSDMGKWVGCVDCDNNEDWLVSRICLRGVSDRVVTVIDIKSLNPYRCWFESCQGFLILSCEEAIKLTKGTLVVLLGCHSCLK